MAHECPDCYTLCHCGGDIDDINFGESPDCKHYRKLDCSGHNEYCYDPKCPCLDLDDDDDADYAAGETGSGDAAMRV